MVFLFQLRVTINTLDDKEKKGYYCCFFVCFGRFGFID